MIRRADSADPPAVVAARIGLGSNLGDRRENMRAAADRLADHPAVVAVAASRLYESPPMGPPQGAYLNAALMIETTLSPLALLALCRRIEEAGRRQRSVHWGPRTIDLDILDYAGETLESDELTLPHPGIADRDFVLAPLRDVVPEWRHPADGTGVDELLARCADSTFRVVADAGSWCRTGHPSQAESP